MTKQHIFTKAFWNKSRLAWVSIVGLCTTIPIVFGSVLFVTNWAEAKYVSPYIENKIISICEVREKPLKQDLKTIVNDIRFVRGCLELSTPKNIQDKVVIELRNDSILHSKYLIQ